MPLQILMLKAIHIESFLLCIVKIKCFQAEHFRPKSYCVFLWPPIVHFYGDSHPPSPWELLRTLCAFLPCTFLRHTPVNSYVPPYVFLLFKHLFQSPLQGKSLHGGVRWCWCAHLLQQHKPSAFQSVAVQVVDWHDESEPLFSLFFSLSLFISVTNFSNRGSAWIKKLI